MMECKINKKVGLQYYYCETHKNLFIVAGACPGRQQEKITRLQAENERLHKKVHDILLVDTTDGMTASEWVDRTAKAEAENERLREALKDYTDVVENAVRCGVYEESSKWWHELSRLSTYGDSVGKNALKGGRE